ncbi:MAG: FAD-dependent oxidoreductase [Anaerolineales bacterium]|nr:FAD-dependent oxidoreductase [Anaerolineales bacterium]
MQNQARVVIIGGGITGCSIAYHLAQMGWTDVLLLDKGELTSGSTWHAAGLVTQFHTSPTLMRLRIYSVNLYRQLQAETGPSVGWHEVGSLRLASSSDHFKFLQRQIGQAKALGMDVEMISPAEALKIFPYMSDKALYGALYLPGDGHLDPSGVTLELARRARQMGVTVQTGVRVTGFDFSPTGEVRQVKTDQGDIKTETAVIAAGMWGRQVGAMAGINLPITPLIHQHLATKPIPGHELPHDTPVLRDPYYLFYMREEVRGFLIGGFEVEPKAWSVEGVAWDFTQKLLPSDWELFDPIMEGAIRRVPLLEQAELIHLVNGPEGITPDSRPLVGPAPGRRGLFVACGLSHTGFGAGGALGDIVAQWIVNGEPDSNVSELNVRRFGPIYEDRVFAAERARESYKYYYELRYPHDENEWARERRLSPLDSRLLALGGVFGEKNGWERVNYFEPGRPGRRMGAEQKSWGWGRAPFFEQVGQEHRAVRERAGLFDLTSFGKIEVRGPGALALLQQLAGNYMDRPVGSLIYTQLLNPAGGIESDLTVTRLGQDHFRLITGSNFVAGDLGWLTMHLPPDGSVEVRDVTDEWACIALWGPAARTVLQMVTPHDVSNTTFPYLTARTIELNGVEVWAGRVSYVGELGWELYVTPDQAGQMWDTLLAAGRDFGLQSCGYKVLDSLRLEKGYRYWSADITPTDNPLEAGLGFCVRFEKEDFVGREALLKIKSAGLRQKLCTLVVGGEAGLLYGGEPVYANSRIIGRIRSGGYGYTIGQNIGLAYLPLDLAEKGTQLEVGIFGERVGAEVAANVLYDPQGLRLRA